MVIVIPLPAANVKVSVAESATTSSCPETEIVLNTLLPPPPEEAIVTESPDASVVRVIFEPATKVSVSLLESAATLLCPLTAIVPKALPPADIELNDNPPDPSVTNA